MNLGKHKLEVGQISASQEVQIGHDANSVKMEELNFNIKIILMLLLIV